ncbi:unnamed protein product, partial [Didymodactylos carnosus]
MDEIVVLTKATDPVYGICNTHAGQDSTPIKVMSRRRFNLSRTTPGATPFDEAPEFCLNKDLKKKFLTSNCETAGVYVTPRKGRSILVGVQFVTADDAPERDPLTCTIEGSECSTGNQLTRGQSWVPIYRGPTGINARETPARSSYCAIQRINNNEHVYRSYRVILETKRVSAASCWQFSSVLLFGKL